jgi:hypothetical protein
MFPRSQRHQPPTSCSWLPHLGQKMTIEDALIVKHMPLLSYGCSPDRTYLLLSKNLSDSAPCKSWFRAIAPHREMYPSPWFPAKGGILLQDGEAWAECAAWRRPRLVGSAMSRRDTLEWAAQSSRSIRKTDASCRKSYLPAVAGPRPVPRGACVTTRPACHSERSEESRSECFQGRARFLVVRH